MKMNDLGLYKHCFITENSKENNFVGIQYLKDDIRVFFPLGYEIPKDDDNCRKSIISLLETISLTKAIINQEVKLNDQLREDYAFPISAYLWLIRDYLTNGIYKTSDKVIKANSQGKIKWKQTLNDSPIYSNKGISFLKLYTEHNISVDDIITQIHIICLNKSFENVGWLFGNFKFQETFISNDNIDYLISTINKRLINTYDNHTRFLLINMRNVLLGLDSITSESSARNYGVNGFKDVWQVLIFKLFKSIDLSIYKPCAKYEMIDNSEFTKPNLKLDALLCWGEGEERAYYVLDAKYYKYGTSLDNSKNGAPETSDVEKQIVYGEYVDLKLNHRFPVYNAFIIPFNRRKDNKQNIEFIGFARSNWKDTKDKKEYNYIAVILIDTKFVIDNWSSSNLDSFINDLVSKVKKIRTLLEQKGWL